MRQLATGLHSSAAKWDPSEPAARSRSATACPTASPAQSSALTAVLPPLVWSSSQLATSDCSNLLYSASPADCTAQGRRPAYLLELLRRAAACESSDGLSTAAAANAQASSGTRAGWAAVRAAVLESPHVAKLLTLWASSQVWLAESVLGFCCFSVMDVLPSAARRLEGCLVLASAAVPASPLSPADDAAIRILPGALPQRRAASRPRAPVLPVRFSWARSVGSIVAGSLRNAVP